MLTLISALTISLTFTIIVQIFAVYLSSRISWSIIFSDLKYMQK